MSNKTKSKKEIAAKLRSAKDSGIPKRDQALFAKCLIYHLHKHDLDSTGIELSSEFIDPILRSMAKKDKEWEGLNPIDKPLQDKYLLSLEALKSKTEFIDAKIKVRAMAVDLDAGSDWSSESEPEIHAGKAAKKVRKTGESPGKLQPNAGQTVQTGQTAGQNTADQTAHDISQLNLSFSPDQVIVENATTTHLKKRKSSQDEVDSRKDDPEFIKLQTPTRRQAEISWNEYEHDELVCEHEVNKRQEKKLRKLILECRAKSFAHSYNLDA